MANQADLRVFGIRHHGPGSARSLLRALDEFQPDVVLIEGPPDADAILPFAADAGLIPPVAILVHAEANPGRAAFWPFAAFSPEWAALRWALAAGAEVRFMDLPYAHRGTDTPDAGPVVRRAAHDPLAALAAAGGFSDGERWWDAIVERSGGDVAAFAAIAEAMRALREVEAEPLGEPAPPGNADLADWEAALARGRAADAAERLHEARREAWMRRTIRAARRGAARVAAVCGAWHVPAIEGGRPEPGDDGLLAGLPKEKVIATWVPWTHGRLAASSGYGAGVESPGWYAHLWAAAERGEDATRLVGSWLAGVARLLRDEGFDAPTASVVEAVRLAEALAALRGAPLPGLAETEEAVRAVLCHGDEAPLAVVRRRLVVGECLGAVPEGAPRTPLQRDVEGEAKRLRLKRGAEAQEIVLDLRDPTGLARSVLLHRLVLLGVPWGRLLDGVRGQGTFKEGWRLAWAPEMEVDLVAASAYGTTLAEAAGARAAQRAAAATTVAELAAALDAVILADLAEAATAVMARLEHEAAAGGDVVQLMEALPPAAAALRYGSVRRFDAALLARVVEGMAVRAAAGVGAACRGVDDDEADRIAGLVAGTTDVLVMLARPDLLEVWLRALEEPADIEAAHGLLAGLAARLLMDHGARGNAATAAAMARVLSPAADAARGGAWALGFLRTGAAALIHGDALWAVIDGWVRRLDAEAFDAVLPLLRRAFAPLEPAERRQLGQRAAAAPHGQVAAAAGEPVDPLFDAATAMVAAAAAARFLGLPGAA